MEASETPQLPIDEGPGGADGVVRAIGDRLVIEQLDVTDERAARVVRERAEAGTAGPETVAKAIEIGARVLDSEETAANVDYVRAELERQGIGARPAARRHRSRRATRRSPSGSPQTFDGERDGSVQKEIEEIVVARRSTHSARRS